MKKLEKENGGITLIALVITIIVLLILAGISISMLTGDNSILAQAGNAATETDIESVLEQIQIGLIEIQTEGDGTYTKEDVYNVAQALDSVSTVDEDAETATTIKGNTVDLTNLINGASEKSTSSVVTISTTESFVGCYADLDPTDGKIDGIIYVDLMQTQSATQWADSNGAYSWTVLTEADGVKDYYVSQESYTDDFGTAKVISPLDVNSEETDRFYVMALDDVDSSAHYWYCTACYGGMEDYADTTSGDFGKGYANTEAMISKWNGGATTGYGEGITDGDYPDMWGLDAVQSGFANGWFVPSRAEWSAFASELGIPSVGYSGKGLNYKYWTSTQNDELEAFAISFISGSITSAWTDQGFCVRLSTTF